jgi:hypothetical protein
MEKYVSNRSVSSGLCSLLIHIRTRDLSEIGASKPGGTRRAARQADRAAAPVRSGGPRGRVVRLIGVIELSSYSPFFHIRLNHALSERDAA